MRHLIAAILLIAPQLGATNVVFVMVDDLVDVSLYGSQVKTPNMDRLAARSVVFRNAFCQNPMCNPSRISILSGLRSASSGVYYNAPLADDALPGWKWLPTAIREAGWDTAISGKIFHAIKWDQVPRSSYDRLHHNPAGKYGVNILSEKRYLPDRPMTVQMVEGGGLELGDGRVATSAVDEIRASQRAGKTFALFAGFHRPHMPFRAPKRYFDLYDPSEIVLLAEPPLKEQGYAKGVWYEDSITAATEQERRELMQAYLACVSYMDAQLGRILDALDETNAWENTVVVLVSDHGFHLGEHQGFAWGKAWLSEVSAKVPLMVAASGVRPAECWPLVELIDLYPTVLDLLSIAVTEPVEGVSLVPLLEETDESVRLAACTEYRSNSRHGGVSIRTSSRRYTIFNKRKFGDALFCHPEDPFEVKNLGDPFRYEIPGIKSLMPPALALSDRKELRDISHDRDGDGLPNVFDLRMGLNPGVSDFDPEFGGPMDDASRDGFPNIFHYALRIPLQDHVPSMHPHLIPSIEKSGGSLCLVYEVPDSRVSNILLTLEVSQDLSNWTTTDPQVSKLTSSDVSGYQRIIVPADEKRALFFRLRATFVE